MNTLTHPTELYDILVEQGVEKERARRAVDVYITREEARLSLATKDDLRKVIMWMAGLMVGQVAIITGIMALLFNAYA